jgi:DNA replication protein DnaC
MVANIKTSPPDPCTPAPGILCEGGWHFRDGFALHRCDAIRRSEIRAKVAGERQRLQGALESLAPHGGASFDGYDEKRHKGAAEALAAMRRFAAGRPPKRNVLLIGPNGLGKTRLMLASHFALLEAGVASQYVTTPELRFWFRRQMSFDEEIAREARGWLERLQYAQAIHFDDAGHVENDQRARGEFTEGLKHLLDTSRAAWAVSSNRSSTEMQQHPDLSGTVASRFMLDADLVVMSGRDFRQQTLRKEGDHE